MKKKLLILLVFARVFDIFTTYISRNGDLSGEMNILVRKYGLGWESLLISEVLLIISFFLLVNYMKVLNVREVFKQMPKNISFKNFISQIYYGKKIGFFEMVYSKMNLKILINDFIYFATIMLIIVSFMIGINNLLSAFGFINMFTINNEYVDHNFPKILNILIFFVVVIYINKKRYNDFKKKEKED